jgi:hypothetical protein
LCGILTMSIRSSDPGSSGHLRAMVASYVERESADPSSTPASGFIDSSPSGK